MGLSQITDATVEPVGLNEAKKHLEIATEITRHDNQLTTLIKVARRTTERLTRRAWINQTWKLTLTRFPSERFIQLPRPPLASVTSLAYVDSSNASQTLVENTDFVARTNSHPGCIALAVGKVWPVTEPEEKEAVTITYVAGYGATVDSPPVEVKQAILLTLADWWTQRESIVVGRVVAKLPQSAEWLLSGLHCGMKFGAYEVTA